MKKSLCRRGLVSVLFMVFIIVGCKNKGVEPGDGGGTCLRCKSEESVILDGIEYRTVVIGDQRWLAENVRTLTERSGYGFRGQPVTGRGYCYDDLEENCEKYGALYPPYVAEKIGGVDQNGDVWSLPTVKDWQRLTDRYAAPTRVEGYWASLLAVDEWPDVDSVRGYYDRNDNTNYVGVATDDFGFSLLPGGRRVYWTGGYDPDASDNCYYYNNCNYGYEDKKVAGYYWAKDDSVFVLGQSLKWRGNRLDVYRDGTSEVHPERGYSVRLIMEKTSQKMVLR
jgi:uncharacterized protein (TIGR02145 family)